MNMEHAAIRSQIQVRERRQREIKTQAQALVILLREKIVGWVSLENLEMKNIRDLIQQLGEFHDEAKKIVGELSIMEDELNG